MELPGIGSDSFSNIPEDQEGSEKKEGDICKKYEMKQVAEFASFVSQINLPIGTDINSEELQQAERIESGVSGAMKLQHKGTLKIIKPQVLTEAFSTNLKALDSQRKDISHSKVSESDDSFAHFPRKELLGYRIASLFGLDVPLTELVGLGEEKYASAQTFLSEAISMTNADNLQSCEVDFDSVILTFLFHLFTENIDGHTGNILLTPYDDDDNELVKYKAIPIDYGLIYPRHGSIYPTEFNLLKKGFFKFFISKKVIIQKFLPKLVGRLEYGLTTELLNLMTPQEQHLCQRNLKALKSMLNHSEPSLSLDDFLKAFIERVCKGKDEY